MSISGVIKTLFTDHTRTQALFPRTKVSAVSDDNGVGLGVLLDNIQASGVHIELLWENASPTSNFDEQTLPINWREYDVIKIIANGFWQGCSLEISTSANYELGEAYSWFSFAVPFYEGGVGVFSRGVRLVESGIWFGSCGVNSSSTQNGRITPYAIYGIKGVTV